ncbi:dihydroorotase, multifunctional complex type [Candidatus Omnitrophus magneticus]|uniref:Dihydroorotase n=1 Tax=Candidatus Omnitrophus magneticus TaxID=1609969 RepID=A0A0F0CME1_9BACT|nr:dihydroorotase, multifunctional complex type [Candidatus Omnitrophus magneticus]
MKILIKNGRIIDPSQSLDKKEDILVVDGKIEKIGKISVSDGVIFDAKERIVAPGFIDMHTHLREPGFEDKETIETGTKAAIKGGFTTVCAMPNTEPACDSQAQVRFILDKAKASARAAVLPIGAITKGRKGEYLSEMRDLKDAGCVAISDDGSSVENAMLMRKAMEYASMVGLVVISHCEVQELAKHGVMNEGYWSMVLGLNPIPKEAESLMVERDIELAELTGAKLHIAHVSVKRSVEAIRRGKKRGVNVTAEVTPHHLTLTDEELKNYDTNFKVNPPLRTKEDIEALKDGLKDGTIDVIATDHAPHLESEKEKEFDFAPFGMIGLETAFSLCVKELIEKKYLTWSELIEKFTIAPSRILGYDRGSLKPGKIADIVVIDPSRDWVYEKQGICSKSFNSPFIGWQLPSVITDVFVGGRAVVRDGKAR